MAITLTFTPDATLEELAAKKDLSSMLELLYLAVNEPIGDVHAMKIWHQLGGQFECEDDASEEVLKEMVEKVDRSLIYQMDVDKAKVMLTHPNTLQAMLATFGQIMSTDRKEFEVDPDALDEKQH
jgi:hypothetical protein